MRGRAEVTGALILEGCLVGIAKISRSADQPRHILGEYVKDLAGAFARRDTLSIRRKRGQILVPTVRQFATLHPIDLIRELRKLFSVIRKKLVPLSAQLAPAFSHSFAKVFLNPFRHQELGIFGPAIVLFRETYFVLAEWLAMRLAAVMLVGRPIADMAVDYDQCRAVSCIQESFVSTTQHVQIIGIADAGDIPPVPYETSHHVFTERPRGGTVERDLIVVVH